MSSSNYSKRTYSPNEGIPVVTARVRTGKAEVYFEVGCNGKVSVELLTNSDTDHEEATSPLLDRRGTSRAPNTSSESGGRATSLASACADDATTPIVPTSTSLDPPFPRSPSPHLSTVAGAEREGSCSDENQEVVQDEPLAAGTQCDGDLTFFANSEADGPAIESAPMHSDDELSFDVLERLLQELSSIAQTEEPGIAEYPLFSGLDSSGFNPENEDNQTSLTAADPPPPTDLGNASHESVSDEVDSRPQVSSDSAIDSPAPVAREDGCGDEELGDYDDLDSLFDDPSIFPAEIPTESSTISPEVVQDSSLPTAFPTKRPREDDELDVTSTPPPRGVAHDLLYS